MLDLGILKLNESEQTKNYYVGVWDSELVVTRDPRTLKGFNQRGKIKVIYDGTFFGSLEDREKWVEDMIISYLIEKGCLIKAGETVTGEPVWQLKRRGKHMYKNKITGAVLTDEEYWAMREREIKQLWKEMDEEERQEWGSFEVFRKQDFEDVDLDFEYIED